MAVASNGRERAEWTRLGIWPVSMPIRFFRCWGIQSSLGRRGIIFATCECCWLISARSLGGAALQRCINSQDKASAAEVRLPKFQRVNGIKLRTAAAKAAALFTDFGTTEVVPFPVSALEKAGHALFQYQDTIFNSCRPGLFLQQLQRLVHWLVRQLEGAVVHRHHPAGI